MRQIYQNIKKRKIIEKDKKKNTIWKKIVMMALLFEGWGEGGENDLT